MEKEEARGETRTEGRKMEEEREGRGTKGGREREETQPAPLNRPTELSSY